MVSEKMYELGTKKSTIRTIFEYGRKRAAEIGAQNVFDFSLGNPNVKAPDFIQEAAVDILQSADPTEVHGYTIAPGRLEVREVLAADMRKRFGADLAGKNFFLTAGAAAAGLRPTAVSFSSPRWATTCCGFPTWRPQPPLRDGEPVQRQDRRWRRQGQQLQEHLHAQRHLHRLRRRQ